MTLDIYFVCSTADMPCLLFLHEYIAVNAYGREAFPRLEEIIIIQTI